jgi:predicted dehydrogenase
MPRPFRLALVGAGMITQSSHLPAALASPLVHVEAIIDPAVDRAAGLARTYGLSVRIAPRVDDVFGGIDGALIATPNDTHHVIAVSCLRRGVPVLIEKPLASGYAEGCAIVEAAEHSGQVAAVGYSSRFRPAILLLKELLDTGYFGTVLRFAHQFGTAGGWAPFSAYNLKRNAAGGGVLVVTGTHFLDRMLYFWGYPDEATLVDDSLGGPEANCTATFRYRRTGAPFEGVARYSKTAALAAGLVIETERGYVILGDHDDSEIVFRPHAKARVEHLVQWRGPSRLPAAPSVFQLQLEDFIHACRSHRAPRVDARQGLESLRLIEQLYTHGTSHDRDWYATTVDAAPIDLIQRSFA